MSVYHFSRKPVRQLKFDAKLHNSFVVNKFAFTFIVAFSLFAGMYLGLIVVSTGVYTNCATAQKWSWDSWILLKPIEVECKVHEKVRQ
jgi:hypothetical protein